MERKMKDSGIPWIGMIPKDWEVCKVKHHYRFVTGFTPPSKNDQYYDDNGIPWVTISELNGNKYVTKSTKGISSRYIKVFHPEIVPKGSLLYSFKLSVGQVAITKIDLFTNEAIAAFLKTDNVCLDYLFYSSQCCIEKNANENIYGAKLLNQELINNAIIVFPPLPTQQRIVDFLDRKCAEIDELAALQETMIAELKRYKQSVITEAVTKGLDPNVAMKDSGVEWIGEIPIHWEMKAVKYVLQRRNQKNDPIISEERLSLSIGVGITKYAEKTTNLDRFKDDFTQYQLAYPDDIVLNSMNMIVGAVGKSNYMGCVSPVYYVMIPKNSVESTYYSYILNTPKIRDVYHSLGKGIYAIERGEGRVNTCRLKVSFSDFGRIEIPVPPIKEQQRINDYITTKCAEIDELIAIKQQKIKALKEYKKSVIFEYVTGKKEI